MITDDGSATRDPDEIVVIVYPRPCPWPSGAGARPIDRSPGTPPSVAVGQGGSDEPFFYGYGPLLAVTAVQAIPADVLHLPFPRATTPCGVVTRVAVTCAACNVDGWVDRVDARPMRITRYDVGYPDRRENTKTATGEIRSPLSWSLGPGLAGEEESTRGSASR